MDAKVIPLFAVHMPESAGVEVAKTLYSGYVTEGPKAKEFERQLADFIGNPFTLAVNSGTSALHLAMRLAGIGPGMEVLASPMTCTATIVPICAMGARIVWTDIDPTTGNIDPEDVRRKMSRYVRAVVAVDWGGRPFDIRAVRDAVGPRVSIIEDAAHAFGAKRLYSMADYLHGLCMVGTEADFTCFSFQAIKHITTGDGGALAVSTRGDFERGKRLRWFGLERDYKSDLDNRVGQPLEEYGYKFHMNDIAATIGIEQMKHVRDVIARHRQNAFRYCRELDGRISRPSYDVGSAYWLFTIQLPTKSKRIAFMEAMRDAGIATSQVHGRCDELQAFQRYAGRPDLPGVTAFSARQVSIPVHWKLTNDEVSYVIEKVNAFAVEKL